jgi:hypothetical protein
MRHRVALGTATRLEDAGGAARCFRQFFAASLLGRGRLFAASPLGRGRLFAASLLGRGQFFAASPLGSGRLFAAPSTGRRKKTRNPDSLADKSNCMGSLAFHPPSVAVRQAQSLLQAWVCGDLPRLQAELERSTFLCPGAVGHQDREQLELLKSVAVHMKSCRNLYAERTADPQLGLCVDLLDHLASCYAYTD